MIIFDVLCVFVFGISVVSYLIQFLSMRDQTAKTAAPKEEPNRVRWVCQTAQAASMMNCAMPNCGKSSVLGRSAVCRILLITLKNISNCLLVDSFWNLACIDCQVDHKVHQSTT